MHSQAMRPRSRRLQTDRMPERADVCHAQGQVGAVWIRVEPLRTFMNDRRANAVRPINSPCAAPRTNISPENSSAKIRSGRVWSISSTSAIHTQLASTDAITTSSNTTDTFHPASRIAKIGSMTSVSSPVRRLHIFANRPLTTKQYRFLQTGHHAHDGQRTACTAAVRRARFHTDSRFACRRQQAPPQIRCATQSCLRAPCPTLLNETARSRHCHGAFSYTLTRTLGRPPRGHRNPLTVEFTLPFQSRCSLSSPFRRNRRGGVDFGPHFCLLNRVRM